MTHKSPAGTPEALAQEELRTIVGELKGIGTRLRAVAGSLVPASEAGITAQDLDDEMDLSTEIRTVIDCVLTDNLEPATRDLQTASELQAQKLEKG